MIHSFSVYDFSDNAFFERLLRKLELVDHRTVVTLDINVADSEINHVREALKEYIISNNFITAIKAYRMSTGSGLKESKEAIEQAILGLRYSNLNKSVYFLQKSRVPNNLCLVLSQQWLQWGIKDSPFKWGVGHTTDEFIYAMIEVGRDPFPTIEQLGEICSQLETEDEKNIVKSIMKEMK